jgi:GDP-4-dehydro-6-deoxy-D-mannose reductase
LAEGRTLLLLGASGFAGRHVRRAAEAAGFRVIAAGRDSDQADVALDLLRPRTVAAAVRAASPDAVVNLAGAASVAASWSEPGAALAVNAGGVLGLLEGVREHAPAAHVTCVSSAEVYGEATAEKLPFEESLPLEPVTPYGASKAAMEIVCGQYARSRGLRIAILRAFNQLGPGQSPEFAAAGFARQIAAAEAAGADTAELLVGNLSAARDFTDIRDSAGAYVAVAERGLTGTFNLCSGRATSLDELIEEMRGATRLRLTVTHDPALARPSDPPLVYGSAARLERAAGWRPRIPLPRSLADLLDWWRAELAAGGAGSAATAAGFQEP